jgi:hypothetical protein
VNQRILAVLVAVVMGNDFAMGADRLVIKTDWAGLREQVAQRKLKDRGAQISLTSGVEINTILIRVEENGIVVRSNRATQQWTSGKGEALLPRPTVASVYFRGKVGKGGLIGGLAGLGVGAALAGAAAKSMEGGGCEGDACAAVVVLIPIVALGGWLVGRATEKPAPVFVIQP